MKIDARQIPRTLAKLFESPEESLRAVRSFEKKLAVSQGAEYAVGTNSCTAGILASLVAIGVKDGDEVIVPCLSWGGTWSPAALLGATLVPVDCSGKFPAMDPDRVKEVICKKTKAIIAVGLWGHPAGITEIQKTAGEYEIPLIVDAAQLFNSKVNGKSIGSAGDFVVLSFSCTKSLMALGEGGAVLCNSKKYYQRLLLLIQHPVRISFELENLSLHDFNDGINLNLKINPLAAYIGVKKLYEQQLPEIRKFSEKVKEILARHGVSELLPPDSWVRTQASGTQILFDVETLTKSKLLSLIKDCQQIGARASRCCYETITGINSRRKGKLFPWSEKKLRISKRTFPNSEGWEKKLFIISLYKRG